MPLRGGLARLRVAARAAASLASMAEPARLAVVGAAPVSIALLSILERGGLGAVFAPVYESPVTPADVIHELDMYGAMLAVGASLAAVLLLHAAFGGGGVRLAYGYLGDPAAFALGVALAGLVAGLGAYALFAVYLLVATGDAGLVAVFGLAFAADVAGALAVMGLVGGRVEGSWGSLGSC